MTAAHERLQFALKDRYRIERELGQGGMATVWLARDIKHERDVAIKVLREDLSASIGAGRFLREIKIAAQLQHPHILGLLDSGEADGLLYFVMPYVRGQSLRERLTQAGELPVHEAVRLLLEIVDALTEAHAHGVVHRDIKPDNVMVSGRHAMVMDFGVAKAISEATGRNTITTMGVAVGTPTYMSPEQATADPHVDHRSDIYSVGVIAYEMLTGRPPFVGASPQQVLAAHVTVAPDAVSKQRPGLSPALDAIVMRCLAKRPADRFQSAAELHSALEAIATPTGGVTPTETLPHASRARSRWTIAAAVAGVVLVAVAALKLLESSKAASPVTMDRVQFTTSGRAFSPVVSPDGREVVYTEEQCPADTLPCTQRLMLQDVATGARQPITDTIPSIDAVGWSPTGDWILAYAITGVEEPQHYVLSRLGGARVAMGQLATFAGKGDTVLAAEHYLRGSHTVRVRTFVPPWTRSIDSLEVVGPERGILLDDMNASPDGRWISAEWSLEGQQNSTITILDRRGNTKASRVVPRFASAGNGGWNASGTMLLRSVRVGTQGGIERIVVERDGNLGRTDTVLLAGSSRPPTFSRSATGSVFAYDEAQGGESSLYAMEPPPTGSAMRRSKPLIRQAALGAALITPDGSHIVYRYATTGDADSKPQFFIVPFEGGVARAVTPPMAGVRRAAITGDSRRLVLATAEPDDGTRLSTYDLATGRMGNTSVLKERVNYLVTTASGEIILGTTRVGVFLDDSLHERGRVTIPDSLGGAGRWAGSRRGSGAAVMILPPDVATTFKDDWNIHSPVYNASSSGALTPIGFAAMAAFSGFWWLSDGTMLFHMRTGTDPHSSVYVVNPTRLLWRLPFHDPVSLDFSADGRRAVALVRPEVRNVWLVRNFAPAMR